MQYICTFILKAINNNSLDKIDLNAYVKKLLDYYGEDINILASAAGVEQAQIDALINEIKSQDLNAAVKDELEGEIGNADEIKGSLTEAIGKIRKAAEDLTDEQMKDQNLEMTVKATDTGFKIKGMALLKDDGNEVKADYSIRISDDVSSISAPSNITKLRDFKDVLASLAHRQHGGGAGLVGHGALVCLLGGQAEVVAVADQDVRPACLPAGGGFSR